MACSGKSHLVTKKIIGNYPKSPYRLERFADGLAVDLKVIGFLRKIRLKKLLKKSLKIKGVHRVDITARQS